MSNKCDTSLVGMTGGTPMGEDFTNPRDSEYGSIPEPVLHPWTILMKWNSPVDPPCPGISMILELF